MFHKNPHIAFAQMYAGLILAAVIWELVIK